MRAARKRPNASERRPSSRDLPSSVEPAKATRMPARETTTWCLLWLWPTGVPPPGVSRELCGSSGDSVGLEGALLSQIPDNRKYNVKDEVLADKVSIMAFEQEGEGMTYSVSTSEFGKMSDKERAEAVRKLAHGAFESSNGQSGEIDAQIDEFERRYKLKSSELLQLLAEGELSETDEISDWLWLLNFRKGRLS